MTRPRHPKKEVEDVIKELEALGWRYVKGKSHVWGRLLCENADRTGCKISVFSTPKSSGNHAKHLIRLAAKCHCGENDES